MPCKWLEVPRRGVWGGKRHAFGPFRKVELLLESKKTTYNQLEFGSRVFNRVLCAIGSVNMRAGR